MEKNIGTAKDNLKEPIHNWFKFTAGYSFKLVEEVSNIENLNSNSAIFDPFSGCGTTLVTAQKLQIPAFGNEAQEFMFRIIQSKLTWNLNKGELNDAIQKLEKKIHSHKNKKKFKFHEVVQLLQSLYSHENLYELYTIKDFLECENLSKNVKNIMFLALSQTLHKTSLFPISIPYIVRTKMVKKPGNAFETFIKNIDSMLSDLSYFKGFKKTSKIYLHDSRKTNQKIENESIDCCITSPPYLNNLDYGEVSKVHTHFFGITSSWNDITEKVRKSLVTGSTTHYKKSEFSYNEFRTREFYTTNEPLCEFLIEKSKKLELISKNRSGKKSFNILMLLYFEDMYKVLKEIKRTLKKDKNAYLMVGDSAPYGEYIATTEILGKISQSVGFDNYQLTKVRRRGNKWNSLKYRHSKNVEENMLVLQC